MDLIQNDGQRPSLLDLERYHCGELTDDEVAALLPRLGEREHAHLDALEGLKGTMPALDLEALRQRRPSVLQAPRSLPAPANRAWFAGLGLLAAAMVAFFLMTGPADPGTDGVRFRGGAMQMFTLDHDKLVPWDGQAVGQGDVVGFRVNGTGHGGVVVLSIDGTGAASLLWPDGDSSMEPISGDGLVELRGTLTLDDAPGPELFVAVYDRDAREALSEARRAYDNGGQQGLADWADASPDVDVLIVPRLR